jgi:hypothetical protein
MIVEMVDALTAIGRLLAMRLQRPTPPTDLEKDAIRKVWSAIDNTRAHLRQIESGEVPWPSPNKTLVSLWSEAALAINVLDGELSMRLRQKAEYWSDPTGWNRERVRQAGIGIDRVADDARALLQVATPSPPAVGAHDVFVSHASEDKKIARAITKELRARGWTVWIDENEIEVGERIGGSIETGLANSRFGAVVMSETYFNKKWTVNELEGLFALENNDGRKRIIPILHGLSHGHLLKKRPMLGARRYLSTELGPKSVATAVDQMLRAAE